ncbi:hypothetical protein [uncultured Paenibacillus sp.]|nr:hypothetical protein [uncultured Paenibacillus sp.]
MPQATPGRRSEAPAALTTTAGCASEIGNAVGRLVYATVREAAATQHEP